MLFCCFQSPSSDDNIVPGESLSETQRDPVVLWLFGVYSLFQVCTVTSCGRSCNIIFYQTSTPPTLPEEQTDPEPASPAPPTQSEATRAADLEIDLNKSTQERGVPLLGAANQHLKQLLALNSSFTKLCSVPQTPALLGTSDHLKSLLILNLSFTKFCSSFPTSPTGVVLAGASPTPQQFNQLNKVYSYHLGIFEKD